jgi:hypothetical protein
MHAPHCLGDVAKGASSQPQLSKSLPNQHSCQLSKRKKQKTKKGSKETKVKCHPRKHCDKKEQQKSTINVECKQNARIWLLTL